MPSVLKKGETLTASAVVRAAPEAVYAIVSDVTRIPEWSPETTRCTREGDRFTSWNRRRLGVWRTSARVVAEVPRERFGFVVEIVGGQDWTEWTYRTEPGPEPGTTRLTEEFRMCRDLPLGALVFEWLFLLVRDRRTDLQANLQTCVERIRDIAETA